MSIAALTFNLDMVDMLLRHGAELCDTNDRGDTVFHSLIRFSALYPEKESKAVELMAELHRRLKDKVSFQHSSVRHFPLGDTTDTEISLHSYVVGPKGPSHT